VQADCGCVMYVRIMLRDRNRYRVRSRNLTTAEIKNENWPVNTQRVWCICFSFILN